jgi:MFS family permease
MCLALLMVGIDGTIVNVALPSFVRELGASSVDQLVGPVYHRALIVNGPIDDTLVESVVASLLR